MKQLSLVPSENDNDARRDAHHCHARGCRHPVPPEMLMCKPHWFMVPRLVRNAVWEAYRPGQCDDMRPSREWHIAADAAIGFIARKEGRPITPAEARALEGFGL